MLVRSNILVGPSKSHSKPCDVALGENEFDTSGLGHHYVTGFNVQMDGSHGRLATL